MDLTQRRYVLFDYDGTLADTVAGIVDTATSVLKERGLTDEELGDPTRLVGPSFPGAFMMLYGLSREEAEEVTEAYRERYVAKGAEAHPLYEGVPEMLDILLAEDKVLAVATSRNIHMVRRLLNEDGIIDDFAVVTGQLADDTTTKADIISATLQELGAKPSEAVMVGDRIYDIEGSLANGVPCVGCAFGLSSEEELLAAGAAVVVHNVEELTEVLAGTEAVTL